MAPTRRGGVYTEDREAGLIWRYLRTGKTLHALTAGSYGHAERSACGVTYKWRRGDDWYGTGNQSEYERAARLPRCRKCVALTTIGT